VKFTVVTLFPQLIEHFREEGLLGQALSKKLVEIVTVNPRHFTEDAHHTVDDRAFGGGDGMVMKFEPLAKAVRFAKGERPARVAVLTPQGRPWKQSRAVEWAHEENAHFILVCGRYAGIDQRLVNQLADEEISLGDFILNGGEIAACAVIESVARLLPGALGNQVSAHKDSFSEGLLECPQFTRPREVEGLGIPAVLLSGDHKKVAEFERAVSVVRTRILRPDLSIAAEELKKSLSLVGALKDEELRALGLSRELLGALTENR
jgi:tRNA (guanine37-N1)-methyltransferase